LEIIIQNDASQVGWREGAGSL